MESQTSEYKCDVCGAVFRDADALTKHMAIHSASDDGELEQGTTPPMGDTGLPPAGNIPVRAGG
jgi:hypothetical protein